MTAQPKLAFVTCPDPAGARQLAFWDWPAQNGNSKHVVVCVHGLGRQGRDFDELAKDLSRDRRVVAVDIAGRGRSDWLADPLRYQIPTYVQDMLVLLSELKRQGMQALDWVGTSMGGVIGMGLAGHEPLQATFAVRRLVLNDVGPAVQWQAIERIGQYFGRNMAHASLEAAADAMWAVSQGFGPHTRQQWMALSEHMVKTQLDASVRLHYDPAIAKAFALATPESTAQGQAALWALFDAIQAQVLVIRGAESDLLSDATVQEMCRRGPRAQACIIDGVGHAPTLVSLEQRDMVRAFLDAP